MFADSQVRGRRGIQRSCFRQQAARVPLGCAQLRIGYRPINERAHALEIDSLCPLSLSNTATTGTARSLNSCTPPENRFHECKCMLHRVRAALHRALHRGESEWRAHATASGSEIRSRPRSPRFSSSMNFIEPIDSSSFVAPSREFFGT